MSNFEGRQYRNTMNEIVRATKFGINPSKGDVLRPLQDMALSYNRNKSCQTPESSGKLDT